MDTHAPESINTRTSRPVVSTVSQTCIVLLLKGLACVFCGSGDVVVVVVSSNEACSHADDCGAVG